MMLPDGDFVGGGDLGVVLCPLPSCSTPACGFGPSSPSSLLAELCHFRGIVSVPGTVKGDEKWSYLPVKIMKQFKLLSAHSPSVSVSLSSCLRCPEAFSPSTVQRSTKGLNRISWHLKNLACVANTKMKLL